MNFFFITLLLFATIKGNAQSCDMYEINGIPLYFYLVENEQSISTLNDSISYSLKKLTLNKFEVATVKNNNVIDKKNYYYRGQSRIQPVKIRKRVMQKVTVVHEKKLVCLLEI